VVSEALEREMAHIWELHFVMERLDGENSRLGVGIGHKGAA
jgi:hypothetical protein